MKKAMSAALAVLMTQAWLPSLAEVTTTLFRKVRVSEAAVVASRTLTTVQPHPGRLHSLRCSSVCGLDPQCQLWCHGTFSSECLFSDMIVMPTYRETSINDALTCYTRRSQDLATGASIEGSPRNFYLPSRKETNLVDGIYGQMSEECYRTRRVDNPWFLLDFGAPVAFRSLKLFAVPEDASSLASLINIEVRVGKVPARAPGDFRSYHLIGVFTGPATEFNQEITVEVPANVTARFLSVQSKQNGEMEICYVEVY